MLERITKMAEGNPGATRVLCDVVKHLPSHIVNVVFDQMEKHSITGCFIWVAYKDYAKEHFPTFINAVLEEDVSMLATVNTEREIMKKYSGVSN